MSLRLTLIAHGATAATRSGSFPLDEALESRAVRDAERLGAGLGRVDRAWTSPAARARETAEAMGLSPMIAPSLADLDFGIWRGRSLAEAEASDPEAVMRWLSDPAAAPHGGESVQALVARIRGWLTTLTPESGRHVAVTHAAVLRAALIAVLDIPPGGFWRIDIAPLAMVRLQGRQGRWTYSVAGAAASGTARPHP